MKRELFLSSFLLSKLDVHCTIGTHWREIEFEATGRIQYTKQMGGRAQGLGPEGVEI